MSEHDYDTEFTLSTGKLLGIFFGMVAICGIFFSLGYAVGRNSAPGASAAVLDSAEANPVSGNGTAKPASAGRAAEPPAPEVKVATPEAGPEASTPAPAEPAAMAPGSGYMVQVAAVSKQEDAEALVSALRKKEYPVFLVSNPTSKLYHVQVGPFANQKDAEAMKSRLSADGYNAILKK
jgi:DedD protein